MTQHALVVSDAETYALKVSDDRYKIRESLQEFSQLVVSTQDRLDSIANRGFWKRLVSNNTRDLAHAMGDIVTIQQMTLAFVMALITVNQDNVKMLSTIRDELTEVRSDLGYQTMAVSGQQSQILAFQATLDQAVTAVEFQMERSRKPVGGAQPPPLFCR